MKSGWFLFLIFFPAALLPAQKSQSTLDAEARLAAQMKRGEKVYVMHCVSCHMMNGLGTPGLNPSLVDSRMVQGSALDLVRVILLGSQDPALSQNKRTVDADNTMAAYHILLNDEDVAAVTTFIRQTFGKQRDRVREDYVERVREAVVKEVD